MRGATFLGLAPLCVMLGGAAAAAEDLVFGGACDASAAIVTASGRLAVADDENPDMIRVYPLDRIQGGLRIEPSSEVSLEDRLGQKKPKKKEADLEGAATVGDRVYWIGSHSRDGKGHAETDRQVLLASDRDLRPVGGVYRALLKALLAQDATWKAGLEAAVGDPGKDTECPKSGEGRCLAPEKDGLSIEGLGHLPGARDGSREESVLIGLRNPRASNKRALLLPLLNVEDVVMSGAEPRLGAPIELDLGGLAIRDLAWWDARETMLVLAGTKNDDADFRLFQWSGRQDDTPTLVQRIEGLGPEAVVPLDRSRVLLLSDDGDTKVKVTEEQCEGDHWEDGACPCKHLDSASLKSFRGRELTID